MHDAEYRRLWSKVTTGATDECWPFTGSCHPKGHGQIWHRGRVQYAHRVAYESAVGPVPDGLIVRHRCDNPPCCNPAHLLVGTVADNNRDMYERDRIPNRRGEGMGRAATVTEELVRQIRLEAAEGVTRRELGTRCGIHHSTVSAIVTRKTWAHVI